MRIWGDCVTTKRIALCRARKAKKLTQKNVSDLLGISLRMYQRIETGQRTGSVGLWDSLEELFKINQRELRKSHAETIINTLLK